MRNVHVLTKNGVVLDLLIEASWFRVSGKYIPRKIIHNIRLFNRLSNSSMKYLNFELVNCLSTHTLLNYVQL